NSWREVTRKDSSSCRTFEQLFNPADFLYCPILWISVFGTVALGRHPVFDYCDQTGLFVQCSAQLRELSSFYVEFTSRKPEKVNNKRYSQAAPRPQQRRLYGTDGESLRTKLVAIIRSSSEPGSSVFQEHLFMSRLRNSLNVFEQCSLSVNEANEASITATQYRSSFCISDHVTLEIGARRPKWLEREFTDRKKFLGAICGVYTHLTLVRSVRLSWYQYNSLSKPKRDGTGFKFRSFMGLSAVYILENVEIGPRVSDQPQQSLCCLVNLATCSFEVQVGRKYTFHGAYNEDSKQSSSIVCTRSYPKQVCMEEPRRILRNETVLLRDYSGVRRHPQRRGVVVPLRELPIFRHSVKHTPLPSRMRDKTYSKPHYRTH
ncbi:hypothetical protein CLF_104225, partial [Clonorchis sinensis]